MRFSGIFIVSVLMVVFSINASAKQKIYIDNSEIQEYRGKQGIWLSVDSRNTLNFYLKKFGVSFSDVTAVNGKNFSYSEHVFVPYSESYINQLTSSGKARESIESGNDEFLWPILKVERITSAFGIRFGQLHEGIDLPSQRGTPIYSTMDGKVLFSGYTSGHGKSIYIEHRGNFFSRYSHNSVNFVKRGDYVKKGQIIGYVGSTGNSTGNHLHFELRYNDIPMNPLDFLPYKDGIQKEDIVQSIK